MYIVPKFYIYTKLKTIQFYICIRLIYMMYYLCIYLYIGCTFYTDLKIISFMSFYPLKTCIEVYMEFVIIIKTLSLSLYLSICIYLLVTQIISVIEDEYS